jgi:hypothetical protein
MMIFVQLSPRKFIVVKVGGTYNVVQGVTVNPAIARHGNIVSGPSDYDSAMKFFTDNVGIAA